MIETRELASNNAIFDIGLNVPFRHAFCARNTGRVDSVMVAAGKCYDP